MARLVAAQVLLHTGMAGLRVLLPLQVLQSGHSTAQVGLVLALFGLGPLLLAVPMGHWVDRLGTRGAWWPALVLSASGSLLAALWPALGAQALAALLSGLGSGLALLIVQREAGQRSLDEQARRQAFAWVSLAPPAAGVLGPVGIGLVLDHTGHGMPGNAWLAGLLLAVLALGSAWPLRTLAPLPHTRLATSGHSPRAWHLLRQAGVRRTLSVSVFVAACFDLHAFVIPLLGLARGLSASTIGAILGAHAAAAVLMRPLIPRLTAHHNDQHVTAAAIGLTGALLVALSLAPDAWTLGAAAVGLGLSMGSVQPVLMNTLHQAAPAAQRGQAFGLRLTAISASAVAMPLVFGLLGGWIGLTALLWAMGAAALGLLVLTTRAEA